MEKELFNLSDEMLQLVDDAAKSIENKADFECSYNCPCGSGMCLPVGLAVDF